MEAMYLQNAVRQVFAQLQDVLQQLQAHDYYKPSKHLNATIGQHVRHTVELFQALINGYESGIVNYDNRKRDMQIETDKSMAIMALQTIETSINLPDKALLLQAAFGTQDENIHIDTNFNRELAYNLEHAIHHMALIRVGLNELTAIQVPENFGVAASTIKYKAACVQ
jgi:uncharacterized damage-inducible protein DinB